uniref:Uncharacterized protein n=1 Tax=Knipowitschia caucasica TaxID=637954 RepID=A0AAV2M4F5_KNICA
MYRTECTVMFVPSLFLFPQKLLLRRHTWGPAGINTGLLECAGALWEVPPRHTYPDPGVIAAACSGNGSWDVGFMLVNMCVGNGDSELRSCVCGSIWGLFADAETQADVELKQHRLDPVTQED